MNHQKQMHKELEDKKLFEQARSYAFDYMDKVNSMDVFPSEANLANLSHFDEALGDASVPAKEVLELLHQFGSPATTL